VNKPGFVAFTVDKNGKPIAFYQSRATMLRWHRIGMDEAKNGVATGHYQETEFHPWHPCNCDCRHCATCDQCTGAWRRQTAKMSGGTIS
jgi:hypothetical protein